MDLGYLIYLSILSRQLKQVNYIVDFHYAACVLHLACWVLRARGPRGHEKRKLPEQYDLNKSQNKMAVSRDFFPRFWFLSGFPPASFWVPLPRTHSPKLAFIFPIKTDIFPQPKCWIISPRICIFPKPNIF